MLVLLSAFAWRISYFLSSGVIGEEKINFFRCFEIKKSKKNSVVNPLKVFNLTKKKKKEGSRKHH